MRTKFRSVVFRITEGFAELIYARDSRRENQLHVAARTTELYEAFASGVDGDVPDFLDDAFASRLGDLVKETRGIDLANFLSGAVFKRVVNASFEPVGVRTAALIDGVRDLVQVATLTLVREEAAEFPKLAPQFEAAVEQLMEAKHEHATEAAETLREAELHVYTNNHSYMDTVTKFKRCIANTADGGNGGNGEDFTDICKDFAAKAAAALALGSSNEDQGFREMQLSLHAYQAQLRVASFGSRVWKNEESQAEAHLRHAARRPLIARHKSAREPPGDTLRHQRRAPRRSHAPRRRCHPQPRPRRKIHQAPHRRPRTAQARSVTPRPTPVQRSARGDVQSSRWNVPRPPSLGARG
ncbi:hypothetical protein M885DRAFT_507447 [Pelagophyceae sp. CCMP2097]|nr:hypothetical protein M885DRAFT_507447 [Pelagophyceae sp. CCMP2097]|mmetsp:Transcript_30186/g.104312  ORF Transcript_30186/g.104312 Transcript_30186/m.104312 type:complete len:355 (+) Transcript_30186:68-1132(+)